MNRFKQIKLLWGKQAEGHEIQRRRSNRMTKAACHVVASDLWFVWYLLHPTQCLTELECTRSDAISGTSKLITRAINCARASGLYRLYGSTNFTYLISGFGINYKYL